MPKPTKPRAEFEALIIQDVLLIVDLNGPVSVTNDAEAVVLNARNLLDAPGLSACDLPRLHEPLGRAALPSGRVLQGLRSHQGG